MLFGSPEPAGGGNKGHHSTPPVTESAGISSGWTNVGDTDQEADGLSDATYGSLAGTPMDNDLYQWATTINKTDVLDTKPRDTEDNTVDGLSDKTHAVITAAPYVKEIAPVTPISTNAVVRDTHVIDPEGDVTLVLRDADRPFAVWSKHCCHLHVVRYRSDDTDDNGIEAKHESPVTESPTAPIKVGPEPVETIHYKISGKHMELVSPVFRRLLGQISKKRTKNIIARDLDSEALLILLNVLHCQFETISRRVSLELLAKIAVIATNFACLGALGFCADMWILSLKDDISRLRYSRDLMLWLWITRAWNLRKEWQGAALRAVRQSPGTIPTLGLPFPSDLIRKIDEPREVAIRGIIDMIHERFLRALQAANGCPRYCSASLLGIWLLRMQETGLYPKKPEAPFQGLTYEGLATKWKFFSPNHQNVQKSCKCYRNCLKEMEKRVSRTRNGVAPSDPKAG
ncbi:hypothetical protein BJX76DRAFT_363164 [Aspergillus varians]